MQLCCILLFNLVRKIRLGLNLGENMKLNRFAPLAWISLVALSLCACDDSQSLEDDSKPEGEHFLEVLINDAVKGKIDAYDLDVSVYKNAMIEGVDTRVLSISDVIKTVLGLDDNALKSELEKYMCNYESGADGFRPTDKGDKCAPVSCVYTVYSYLDVHTGKLIYDDSFAKMIGKDTLPGCYQVKDLAKILMTSVSDNSKNFTLFIDGANMGTVDLTTLGDKIVEENGQKIVKLSDVFKAIQPNKTAEGFECDLADAEGNKLSADENCPIRSCSDVLKGSIVVDSFDIIDADAAKTAACYEMKGATALYMNTPQNDAPYEVTVYVDDEELAKIDVKTLKDKIQNDGDNAFILISDVISAVKEDVDLSKFNCNYIAADGYDPTQKNACKEMRSCSHATTAKLDLTTQKMSMTDAEAANCHNVSSLTTIKLYTIQ